MNLLSLCLSLIILTTTCYVEAQVYQIETPIEVKVQQNRGRIAHNWAKGPYLIAQIVPTPDIPRNRRSGKIGQVSRDGGIFWDSGNPKTLIKGIKLARLKATTNENRNKILPETSMILSSESINQLLSGHRPSGEGYSICFNYKTNEFGSWDIWSDNEDLKCVKLEEVLTSRQTLTLSSPMGNLDLEILATDAMNDEITDASPADDREGTLQ